VKSRTPIDTSLIWDVSINYFRYHLRNTIIFCIPFTKGIIMELSHFLQHTCLIDVENRSKVVWLFTENWARLCKTPASTRYHAPYPGGLRDHTFSVVDKSLALATLLFNNAETASGKFISSLIKCAYLHDIGKMGTASTEMYIANPNEMERYKSPYIYNSALLPCDHETRSLLWINRYGISLSEEELIAILHHGGAYQKHHDYVNPDNRHPLLIMLHSVDNLSAKILNI